MHEVDYRDEGLRRRFLGLLPYLELGSFKRQSVPSVSLLYTRGKSRRVFVSRNGRLNLRSSHSEVLAIGRALRHHGYDSAVTSGCLLLTNNEPCWFCSGIIVEKKIEVIVVRSVLSVWIFRKFFRIVRLKKKLISMIAC